MNTTASSPSFLQDTTHGCTSRESHSSRHAQANPCRIEPFLMQNRTHRVAEAMPRYLPRVSNPLEHLINTRFTHRLAGIISPWEYQWILPSHHFELLYDFQRLGTKGDKMGPFHLHTLGRYSHTAFSRSNSLQKAPRSSPVRTPVRISRRATRTTNGLPV